MNAPLGKHVLSTYFTLRIGIAVIAIAFPILLYLGGKVYADLPLQDSMSAYYHAGPDGRPMRNWFVGILFAVGVFLYLYKGFSRTENYALNLAGVMAIGIAIFPMQWPSDPADNSFSLHGICALLFFLAIAFVCVRCSRDTLRLIPDENLRRYYSRTYQTLSGVMVLSPVIAVFLNTMFRQYSSRVFWVEAVGIFAFSAYWLTKSRELAITEAERLAVRGEFEAHEGGAS